MRGTRPRRHRAGRAGLGMLLAGLLVGTTGCADLDTGGSTASGEGGAAGLKGETIHFVVSYGPGGGYDFIARTIAPYIEKELGATVVVENQDGAGGLVAANQVYSAEPDGLTIGFFSGQGMAGSTLGGAQGVQFELTKYSYVTRLAADPRVLTVGAKSGYDSIEDVRSAKDFRFASSGPGGSEHIDATVLFPVLGIDGEIVTGYEGSAETELAVTSGDTDATSGTLGTRIGAIESKDHKPVLAIGAEPAEELPDVPALMQLDMDEKSKALAEAHTVMQDMGRLVLAPPGVPADRLAAIEEAFRAASGNPEVAAKMKKGDQTLDFVPGDEARGVAEKVLQAPPAYKESLAKAYQEQ